VLARALRVRAAVKTHNWRLSVALLALCSQSVSGQSVVRIIGDDFKYAFKDFASIWASPLDAGAKDWLIAGAVLGGAALISPFDDEGDRWAIENRDRGFLDAIRPFRRGGRFYSLGKLTPFAAGAYVLGVATNHDATRDGIMGCLAAYGANTTIRHQLVYRLVGRDRPEINRNVGTGVPTPPAAHGDQYDFRLPARTWGQHSFPGGHVANIATCAAFFSHRFEWGWGEPALAGLVAVIGIGRLADRGHWISDQVVGTVFGYAIGHEIARRQLARRRGEVAAPGAASSPYFDPHTTGIRIGITRRF
jgi:membrane-associated phospholipid phosphatase